MIQFILTLILALTFWTAVISFAIAILFDSETWATIGIFATGIFTGIIGAGTTVGVIYDAWINR